MNDDIKPDYPKYLPVLEPKHFHIGSSSRPGDPNCNCLWWWCEVVTGRSRNWDTRTPGQIRAARKLETAILEAAIELYPDRVGRYTTVPGINDYKLRGREEHAAVWNRMRENMGYTEIEDA